MLMFSVRPVDLVACVKNLVGEQEFVQCKFVHLYACAPVHGFVVNRIGASLRWPFSRTSGAKGQCHWLSAPAVNEPFHLNLEGVKLGSATN